MSTSPTPAVVTLGEIMLRLSPPGHRRFVQADSFDATYGGGEANVAVSLAQFGVPARFVSKVPDNAIGQAAVNHLRRYGVDTRFVMRGGNRLGIYFLETGASQRVSNVIYDRAASAVHSIAPDDVDWEAVFDGASWFHWTGITPALGNSVRTFLHSALGAARSYGVRISCDLNYRKKLWTTEQAQATMSPLMEYVDVCIANEEDAERSLGFRAGSTDVEAGELDEEGYFTLAHELKDAFDFQAVAITLRESYSEIGRAHV